MAAGNIEQFNQCVAAIFGELYAKFPVPTTLMYEHLPGFQRKPFDLSFPRSTFLWLKSTGYVCGNTENASSAADVVLSAKGLECLKGIPETTGQSIGDKLVEATKEVAAEGTKKVLADLASKALTGAFLMAMARYGG